MVFPFDNVSGLSMADALVYLLCAALAISLVVVAFLIYLYNGKRSYSSFSIQHYNIKATPSLFIVKYMFCFKIQLLLPGRKSAVVKKVNR